MNNQAFDSVKQLDEEITRIHLRHREALLHGDQVKVRAMYSLMTIAKGRRAAMLRRVMSECGALAMIAMRAKEANKRERLRYRDEWPWPEQKIVVEAAPGALRTRRTPSLALHEQVVGRCTRIVEAGDVEFSVGLAGELCASAPYSFECEPIRTVPSFSAGDIMRINRLEAWKARQGIHAAFNGKMPVGYWVGEARKATQSVLSWSRTGVAVGRQNRKRYMQYARIALHGQVYAFKYHSRFVGHITAMSYEAARREAENQAMLFSPTAPIEQILSGIQLKAGH